MSYMERVMGIEPRLSAWEADVLPLNYTRIGQSIILLWVASASQRRSRGEGLALATGARDRP
jgi:hypothetical protein